MAELARETGWSARHLQDRFRRETGLTPKAAARVIRFDRARHLLTAGPPPPRLAELAPRCGHFDQAHLAREFRAPAGAAPSAWLAAEGPEAAKFRNVQGGAAGAATEAVVAGGDGRAGADWLRGPPAGVFGDGPCRR
ncbi:helix-turn-helix domain-containing protein [Kitasatospora aureofaciens]|uniref:helix-turn-helix domain-containing protein n=1 Tax=Kitasatospora aureofaciens TaxID=1894 RepID=UPI0036F46F4B